MLTKLGFENVDINNDEALNDGINVVSSESKCDREISKGALLKYAGAVDLAITYLNYKTCNGKYINTDEDRILKLKEIIKDEYDILKKGYDLANRSPLGERHTLNVQLRLPYYGIMTLIRALSFAGIIEKDDIVTLTK